MEAPTGISESPSGHRRHIPAGHRKPVTRLWRWRAAHGLSQQDVADLVGLDVSYIGLIELGKRKVRPVTRAMIARRLGVRITELFEVEEAPEQPESAAE